MEKIYGGPDTKFQFELPQELRDLARDKAKTYGIDLAPFLRIALEDFIKRSPMTSLTILRTYNKKHNKRKK